TLPAKGGIPVEVLIPLLGAVVTAVSALLLSRRVAGGILFRLLVGGLALGVGSALTGAVWAALETQADVRTTGSSSWPHTVNAFPGMTLAFLCAALALVVPAVGFRLTPGQVVEHGGGPAPAHVLPRIAMGLCSLVVAVLAAGLAVLFWFGAASW